MESVLFIDGNFSGKEQEFVSSRDRWNQQGAVLGKRLTCLETANEDWNCEVFA